MAGSLTSSAAMGLLDTISGINQVEAEAILAEIGLDMSHFPSATRLAAWAGLAPGNHQGAGKRYSSRIRPGNELQPGTR